MRYLVGETASDFGVDCAVRGVSLYRHGRGARDTGLHQGFQGFEIDRVPVAAGVVFFFGGFQDLGDVFPAFVADYGFEAFEADLAFAYVVVAVYSAA